MSRSSPIPELHTVDEELSSYQTSLGVVTGTEYRALYSTEGYGKILFQALEIPLRPNGSTLFFFGGGTSSAWALGNVRSAIEIFGGQDHIRNIILAANTNGCLRDKGYSKMPREGELIASELLLNLVFSGVLPVNQDFMEVSGYSTGTGTALAFSNALQNICGSSVSRLTLMDPVGILEDPNLMKRSTSTTKDIILHALAGSDSTNWAAVFEAVREGVSETAEAWVIPGRIATIADIIVDLALNGKYWLRNDARSYGIDNPVNFRVPFHHFAEGEYQRLARQLHAPLAVDVLLASRGYDPVIALLASELPLGRTLPRNKNVFDVAGGKARHALRSILKVNLLRSAFSNIPDENLSVDVMNGAHTLFMAERYRRSVAARLAR